MKNLARRLERLEEQLAPATEEPLVIVVNYFTPDGEVSEAYRLTLPNLPLKLGRWRRP